MTISQTFRSIILADLTHVYNDIIDNHNFCIIKTNFREENGFDKRRAILCNMLRSSGFGFVSTKGLANFPHESDHVETSESLLVPELPFNLADKITKMFGGTSYLYNDRLKANKIQEHNIHSYAIETNSIPKEMICENIDQEHISQVNMKVNNYHKKSDNSEWQYDTAIADPLKLDAILRANECLFDACEQEDIYRIFHLEDFELNTCFFIFSKYMKYMPAISFIKCDDFGDYGIAGALDAYWPLI